MRVVVNTSPLIALDRIGRLSLLQELYGQIIRPQAVLDELRAGQSLLPASSPLLTSPWIITEPNPSEMVLRKELGAGETAALTVAHNSKADLLILDDLQARLVAEGLGLRITGTLGVLLAAHRVGLESDIRKALLDLRSAGFYVSDRLIRQMSGQQP
jgi:predicted nucleic acid-binding protein